MPNLAHSPLRYVLRLNVAWACWMALAFGLLLATGQPRIDRAVLLAAAIAFVVVSVVALRAYRWAVVIVLGVSVLLLTATLPFVLINVWAFVMRDPLYLDSPGTILVVAIEALVLTFPPLVTVSMFARRWRELRSLLLAR